MKQLEAIPDAAQEAESAPPCPYLPGEMTSCLLAAIQELNGAADLRTGLARMADLLHNVLGHDYFSVLLLDELGRELRYELASGVPPDVVDWVRVNAILVAEKKAEDAARAL